MKGNRYSEKFLNIVFLAMADHRTSEVISARSIDLMQRAFIEGAQLQRELDNDIGDSADLAAVTAERQEFVDSANCLDELGNRTV